METIVGIKGINENDPIIICYPMELSSGINCKVQDNRSPFGQTHIPLSADRFCSTTALNIQGSGS